MMSTEPREQFFTAIVRSAEEITGQRGCKAFFGEDYRYTELMNALAGTVIAVKRLDNPEYDYITTIGQQWTWKQNWLRAIKPVVEEPDWTALSEKAKTEDVRVLVRDDEEEKWRPAYLREWKSKWEYPFQVFCPAGFTRWSSKGDTVAFKFGRLPNERGE
ncbi:MAG: hypothetical protein ABIH23_08340 [bacterium]